MNNRNLVTGHACCVFAILSTLTGNTAVVAVEPPTKSSQISVIFAEKETAELGVRIMKEMRTRVIRSDYLLAEKTYNEAEELFNAFLEHLERDIVAAKFTSVSSYQNELDTAVRKMAEFRRLVRKNVKGTTLINVNVAPTIDTLSEAFEGLVKPWVKETAKERAKDVTSLDNYKWDSFESVWWPR